MNKRMRASFFVFIAFLISLFQINFNLAPSPDFLYSSTLCLFYRLKTHLSTTAPSRKFPSQKTHTLYTPYTMYKTIKTPILISTLAIGLFVLAGCATQTATNTNTVTNTNTANENTNIEMVANTNETVSNENTNDLNANSDVDTSGWLTYTNDEYGFSFQYPADLGEVVTKKSLNSDKQVYVKFESSDSISDKPLIQLFEDDHNILVEGDVPSPPNLTADSFNLEPDEFADEILNPVVKSAIATEKFNGHSKYYSLEILGSNMGGEYSDVEAYIHSDGQGYYLVISQRNMNSVDYSKLVDSVRFNS